MISVRLATLADAAAITRIHTSDVSRWERMSSTGDMVAVNYDELSLYERWRHGGPWMSVEMCAVHLYRLLGGSGVPLVAEIDGEVLAEAEIYENFEPFPFGHHLDLSIIVTHTEHRQRGLATALLDYIVEMARLMHCERVTIANTEAAEFYEHYGFQQAGGGQEVRFPAQAGRAIYQVNDLTDWSPTQIKGWYMLLGRYASSRQEWEKLFPERWAAGIPEFLDAATAHVKMTVAGQTAILFLRDAEGAHARPGDGAVYCWSPRPMTGSLMTAIRDWGQRLNYRQLITYVMEQDNVSLPTDAALTGYSQTLYQLNL